jgi:hypothetical protein
MFVRLREKVNRNTGLVTRVVLVDAIQMYRANNNIYLRVYNSLNLKN